MRFERLDLAPYGRFADLRLAFSADAALHVVLGRNEAGKTTTLEAIKDFLFGFPDRTSYGFLHDQQQLRVGGVLRLQGGANFEVTRRKGRLNTLIGPTDQPVSDEPLRHALGSVDRKTFETEFGLSQKKLREGGEALLQAGGALAETLAAGSAGLGALVKLRDRLNEEAGKLFTAKKSAGKDFYVALDAFTTADRTLRDAVVRADELKKADQKRADALNTEQRLREEQEEVSRQLALRERANRTHQTLVRLDAITRGLQAFADLPGIDAGALSAARAALNEDRAHRTTLAQLAAEAQAEAQEIAARVVDRPLLDEGAAIEALREKLGAVREADNDLPRRVEARAQAIHQLDDLARRLGLDDHEALLAAPPSDAEIAMARHALDARREAARRRDEARARTQEAERKCADLDRAAAPDAVADPEPLRRRLDALAERIADAERLRHEGAALDRQTRELAEFAARLDPPVPDTEALARAPLPAAAEVAAFAKADQARTQAGEIAARELEKAKRSLEAAEAALKAREREAAGATRADWLVAREARDRGLDRLAGALDGDARLRRETYDQSRALVLAADAVADRYVEDVGRATRLEAAREDCAARRADLARAQAQADRHAAEREAAQSEWLKMWTRSGFAPRAPSDMTRWLDQVEALLKGRAEIASRRDETQALRARVAEAEASLAEVFTATSGFETAYREARAELAGRQAAFEAAAKAARARAQAAETAREAAAELESREAELAALSAGWGPAMGALRLAGTATAEAAEAALAAWAAVAPPRTLMERESRSVEGIERFLNQFAREVRTLAERLAEPLADAKPEETVARLVERLAEARRISAERAQLEKSAESRAARRRAEEAKRQALAPILAAARVQLCAAADDRLALALERCEARRDLEAERAQTLQQLVQAGDGRDEAELRAEQQGLDPALLADEIATLKGRREELDLARRDAARAVRDAEAEYEALSRGRDAAEAARKRTEAAREILDVAEHWLSRAAAAKLAARAIERHRAAAQDPLIARAGALFALATAGSFSGLAIGYDDVDRPILVARRPSGQKSVKVEGLSEGARDQLFLALRLALLERRAGEPLPFIGDDLLASFDDERARHTLGLLAEFGQRRQTILFTHHARVAEIAAGLAAVEVIEM